MPVLHPATGGGYIAAPMGACPDENVLVQLAHGGVESPSLRATLQVHLDGCGTCRRLVAAVAGGSAPLAPRETFAALAAGTTLGRYRVERLIGVGGMGVLYVAHDTRLDRRVALKLMHPSQDDEAGKARLWREAQAMARLSHPNVVNVFDLGEYEGQLFVAMELVEGGTLRDWLKAPPPWPRVLEVMLAAGHGLAAAHRAGVVHRDFKPENVLIGADGRARVTDFGLARPGEPRAEQQQQLATGPIDITRTGTMMGTPAYMSPEQLLRQPADARSDQYSYCVALYEALYGARPFEGSTLDQVRANVLKGVVRKPALREGKIPDRLWEAIARGLSIEPAQRFASMDALLLALGQKPRSRVWPWAAAAVAALTLVVGLARAELVAPAPAPAIVTAVAPTPPVAAVAPAPEQASPAPELEIVLRVGERTSVRMPGAGTVVARVGVEDPEVVGVEAVSGGELRLAGKREGTTSLRAWTRDGQRHEYPVRVVAAVEREVSPSRVAIVAGENATLTVPGLARVAVGDAAVAEVKTVGKDDLQVTCVAEGTTTLLVWTSAGDRFAYTVQVRKRPVSIPAELSLSKGEQRVLDVPGMVRVAVGNPQVVDVKTIGGNELLVVARGSGRTNVLVWTSGGARHEVRVVVP
jgi:eukaryotic-like serine/threonine-protein kinase